MTIAPVRDASGATTRYIAIKQDVTERKRRDQAIQEERREVSPAGSQHPRYPLDD